MNIKIVLFSFSIIVGIHYFTLTYLFKEKPLLPSKTNSQIISIQLSQIKKQEIKKTVVKEKIKPKTLRKTKAKVKSKQKPKKIKKNISKKPPIKKLIDKKIVKKKLIVKEKEKEVIKERKKISIAEEKIKIEKRKAQESQLLIIKQSKKSKENYFSKLKQYIASYKSYPSISRRLEQEGTSMVSFRVLRNGSFTNIKLIHSSGEERLDDAALESIHEAEKFKPFDSTIKEKYLDFKVQLEYKLE